jgi:hypothetical protein
MCSKGQMASAKSRISCLVQPARWAALLGTAFQRQQCRPGQQVCQGGVRLALAFGCWEQSRVQAVPLENSNSALRTECGARAFCLCRNGLVHKQLIGGDSSADERWVKLTASEGCTSAVMHRIPPGRCSLVGSPSRPAGGTGFSAGLRPCLAGGGNGQAGAATLRAGRFAGAARGMETLTVGPMPAVAAMSIRVSSENRLTLPRIRSDMRGWVTPKKTAACAWVMPCWRMTSVRLIIKPERARILAALWGVSSMASRYA